MLSQQRDELLYRNSRTAENRAQSAAIQFFVIRDYNLAKRLVAAKYHVNGKWRSLGLGHRRG
jgi:hypothetical protein